MVSRDFKKIDLPSVKMSLSDPVQSVHDFENSDFTAVRKEALFEVPFLARCLPLLKDSRDLHLLQTFASVAAILLPVAGAVFYMETFETLGAWTPLLKLMYWPFLLLCFGDRFILALHFSSHRPLFKKEYRWIGAALHNLLCPFFGLPGVVYPLHHVVMHHTENNHGLDLTATEPYQRDRVSHLLLYMARMVFLTPLELFLYAVRTKRFDWMCTLVIGFAFWLCGQALLWRVSPGGTFTVFTGTYFVVMSALALGNYSQHIFVNPASPSSNENLTYNCCDCEGNRTSFDDGYHVVHHKYARLHWAELAQEFWAHKEDYAEKGAWLFRGCHFMDVGLLVLSGQLEKLARDHFVFVAPKSAPEQKPPSVGDVIRMFEERLKPVPAYESKRDLYVKKLWAGTSGGEEEETSSETEGEKKKN